MDCLVALFWSVICINFAFDTGCSFVAGVIGRERIPTFERMLWRVCRGNVFLRQADIEDSLEDPTTVSALVFAQWRIHKIIRMLNVTSCCKLSLQTTQWITLLFFLRATMCTSLCSSSSSRVTSWRIEWRRFVKGTSTPLAIPAHNKTLWHSIILFSDWYELALTYSTDVC